jgi:hypothetical protein
MPTSCNKLFTILSSIFFCTAVLFSSVLPARAQDQLPHVPTIDDLFAEVGNRFPEFGGLYIDPDKDTLYVWVLPGGEEHLDRLDAAITQVFADERPTQTHMQPLAATYSFRQLKEWYDRMSPQVLAIPGAVLTDIDDEHNRLTVAVERMELASQVEAELAATSVPREAVDIVEEPAATTEQTLQDFRRPLVGGIQIEANLFPGQPCTLGFNALRQGNGGFVTNSHCTNVQGGAEGTVFYQEDAAAAANRAGLEFVDPCYFPAAGCPAPAFSGCPNGRLCRYSDSAFALALTGYTRGEIARPVFNTINWNQRDVFFILEKGNLAVVGTTVQKVGRTTGWTQGNVTRVCARLNQPGNITMLCNNQATYASMPGDSGSPVFGIRQQGQVWTVALLGIHWGRVGANAAYSPIGGNSATFFGSTSGVQSPTELGPLQVCLNTGFTC